MDPRNCGYCFNCAMGKYDKCQTAVHNRIAAENMGVLDFQDTEGDAFVEDMLAEEQRELAAGSVPAFVRRLASGKPVGYTIGSKYTGKREYHWDSRSGVYSESLPLMGDAERMVQLALCPPQKVRRRHKSNVRQK